MIRENRCTAGGATATETGINILKKKIKNYCKCCGKDHPRNKEDYPAKDSKGHFCGKVGHWEVVCMNKKKQKGKPRRNRSKTPRRGEKPTPKANERKGPFKKSTRKVHYIGERSESEEEYDTLEYGQITFNTIDKRTTDTDTEIFTKIELKSNDDKKKYMLRAKVDTGAQGNTLPLHIYIRSYFQKT